jgi:hypothetical protein
MNRRTSEKGVQDDDTDHSSEGRSDAREMTVDEAVEVYANEWIFMEVTERDEKDAPLQGIVLDHHRRRDHIQPTIMKKIEELKAVGKAPERVLGYHVFYGVRLYRTKADWEEYKKQTGLFGGGRDRREQ